MQALPVLPLAPLTGPRPALLQRKPSWGLSADRHSPAMAQGPTSQPALPLWPGETSTGSVSTAGRDPNPSRGSLLPPHSSQAWPSGVTAAGAPCGPLGCAPSMRSTSPG